MPTLRFPPPLNDDDFDALVRQIAERKFGVEATRYGRNGQAQHGVDITLTDAHGRLIAIQSKHTEELTKTMMDAEIKKLFHGTKSSPGGFPERVDELIFATSAPRDTKQTDHSLAIAKSNPPLRVTVWAWDHLNELLNTMPSLAATYCAAILAPIPLASTRSEHARFLRQALDRPALLDTFRYEANFEKQRDALRDIAGFMSTGNLYDRHRTLVSSVLPYTEDDKYGRDLTDLKRALQSLIRHIELHMDELKAYTITHQGRGFDHGDVILAKVYVGYESKRIEVINRADGILAEFNLKRLQN